MTGTAARLVSIAREILLAEGAAAVSMRRVAAAAGVTPMTIYRHYANREALLSTIVDESFAEIAARWAQRPSTGGFDERVADLLDDHLDFALGQPHLYDLVFTDRREGARRWPQEFREGGSPSMNVVAQTLTDGMRQGILRDQDVWDLALTVTALIHGLVQLYRGGRVDLSETGFRLLCHQLVGKVLDGCRA